MSEPDYTEFEQGERQALLQLRSFIARHGVKEVGEYAAQRLHDIRMDALPRRHPVMQPKVDAADRAAKSPPR